MPNFRKTTDPDCEMHVSVGMETEIKINVSIHPKDIDRLYEVLADFLKNDCTITNDFLTQIEKEHNDYDRR